VPSTTQLALVTGTTSGIGLAVARQLLDNGWTVAGIARRAAQISHTRYHHIAADLADLSSSVAPVEAAIKRLLADRPWQRVGLVNNAASADLLTSFEAIDPLALLRLYALNTAAPVWLMGLVIRESPREAVLRIVNVSSGAAVVSSPGSLPTAAARPPFAWPAWWPQQSWHLPTAGNRLRPMLPS